MTETHSQQDRHKPTDGYDRKEVNVKALLWVAVAGVLFMVVSAVVLDGWFTLTKEEVIYTSVLKPESISLKELRAREDEVLNSYKLLDSAKGVYQIPIERALELYADEAFRTQTEE